MPTYQDTTFPAEQHFYAPIFDAFAESKKSDG